MSSRENRPKEFKNSKYFLSGNKSAEKQRNPPKTIEPNNCRLPENFTISNAIQKALDEIESRASTSESEDFEEIEVEEEKPDCFIIEEPDKFFQLDIFSDEDLLSEKGQHESENELAFADMFEDVPEMDELSLASTNDLVDKPSIAIGMEPTVSEDLGKFVNPLTGVKSSCSTLSEISKEYINKASTEESISEGSEKEDKQSQGYQSDISNEEILEQPDDFEDVKEPLKDDDDILQLFLEKDKQTVTQSQEDAAKADLIRKEQERLNQQHTLEFLNKLIDHCVAKAEYIDEDIILRKSLDKTKLMKKLHATYNTLEKERRVTQFLNRKCVEYFKRKSCFRLITPDHSKTIKSDTANFHNVLDNLDNFLITEEKMKNQCSSQVLELRQQYREVQQHSMGEVDRLEHVIKTTFHHENFDQLQTTVNNLLNKMAVIRKEISKVRLRLLLKQHQVSRLREQRKHLEDLGNGLNLTQYETMETDTNVLSKKLEERNSALKKLHTHYNFDLHNMAHLKERQQMLRHIVKVQKHYLEELHDQEKEIRTYVLQLKVKRKQLRTDLRNISFQSGLLDKPALMKDYDETVETANKLRQTVQDLKCTVERLTTKVTAVQEM